MGQQANGKNILSCSGLEKTKEHVVFREVEHLTEGRTFNDVKELVEETYAHIDQLSIFDKISIEVDASDEVSFSSAILLYGSNICSNSIQPGLEVPAVWPAMLD